MIPNALCCPYCNSHVPIAEPLAEGQRVPCPRCGAAFPYHAAQTLHPDTVSATSAPAAWPATRRRSNWLIAGGVLGVMALMAAVGLMYALKTKPDRRDRDPKGPLGYVPGDCNVLAAVHVTKALEEPAGRQFLERWEVGPTALGLAHIEKWTGIKLEEINQVVLGAKYSEGPLPERMVLVVQTRGAYDVGAVRAALQANRQTERGKKTLYRFKLDLVPKLKWEREAELWCPAETILVVSLHPLDMDAVPLTPVAGVEHFAPPLQALLQEPLGQGSHAYLVAHAESWDKTAVHFKLAKLPKEDQAVLSKVQTVGLWLRFDQSILLTGLCRTGDDETAKALGEYLIRNQLVEEDSVQVQRDGRVALQVRTNQAAIEKNMKQLFSGLLPGLPGR